MSLEIRSHGGHTQHESSFIPLPGCHLPLFMNRWGIPYWLETEVLERDKHCVYCGVKMVRTSPLCGPRKTLATWEHIINDASIISRGNIARCCMACNASKGTKRLSDWLDSCYCQERGINRKTVAKVVQRALRKGA